MRVRFYNSLPAFISLSVCTQIHHLVYKAYFEVSHLVLIMVHGKGRPRFIASAKILVSWYKTRLILLTLHRNLNSNAKNTYRYTVKTYLECYLFLIKNKYNFIWKMIQVNIFPEIKKGLMHRWSKWIRDSTSKLFPQIIKIFTQLDALGENTMQLTWLY